MNNEEFYFSDFTELNYKELLRLAKLRNGTFCTYQDYFEKKIESPIIWRHDIDFSIHRAVKLAEIEADEGIKSTYFIHFNSMFYNVLEKENIERVKNILQMGHEIGLHFDCALCPQASNGKIEEEMIFYKNLINDLFGMKIKAFSFHNPTSELLSLYSNAQYVGLYNAYAEDIQKKLAYCSDSNGYWRYKRLKEFLSEDVEHGICVLTHPGWWTPCSMSPRQRIQRVIDGRKKATEDRYEADLLKAGRINLK